MKLAVAPAQYDQREQQLARDAIAKNDMEVVHFGRDIELARGEKVILRSPNGSRFFLTVSDAGVLGTTAL